MAPWVFDGMHAPGPVSKIVSPCRAKVGIDITVQYSVIATGAPAFLGIFSRVDDQALKMVPSCLQTYRGKAAWSGSVTGGPVVPIW